MDAGSAGRSSAGPQPRPRATPAAPDRQCAGRCRGQRQTASAHSRPQARREGWLARAGRAASCLRATGPSARCRAEGDLATATAARRRRQAPGPGRFPGRAASLLTASTAPGKSALRAGSTSDRGESPAATGRPSPLLVAIGSAAASRGRIAPVRWSPARERWSCLPPVLVRRGVAGGRSARAKRVPRSAHSCPAV